MPSRRYIGAILVFTMLLLTGCSMGAQEATGPQQAAQDATGPQQVASETVATAEKARAHLEEILALMQERSINRLTIDWEQFRAKVFAKAAGAQSITDTHPAILEALTLLEDNHSFYLPKTGGTIRPGVPVSRPVITTPEIPSTIGYIRVDGFTGFGQPAVDFATIIQRAIASADSAGVTGWIVDLRQNTGGNMWPMIAGLSPLLDEGLLGSFVDPTGAKIDWELRAGLLYYNGDDLVIPIEEPYRVRALQPRVAVLTSLMTVSSGEASAIAFRGQPGVRSFGAPTFGLSTANEEFSLSDGSRLLLTVSAMADRTGKSYGVPVVPDEVIEDSAQAVERAIAWLLEGN